MPLKKLFQRGFFYLHRAYSVLSLFDPSPPSFLVVCNCKWSLLVDVADPPSPFLAMVLLFIFLTSTWQFPKRKKKKKENHSCYASKIQTWNYLQPLNPTHQHKKLHICKRPTTTLLNTPTLAPITHHIRQTSSTTGTPSPHAHLSQQNHHQICHLFKWIQSCLPTL